MAPRNTPCVGEVTQPSARDASVVRAIVITICKPPPPKLMPFTFLSSEKENSTPSANSKKATPN